MSENRMEESMARSPEPLVVSRIDAKISQRSRKLAEEIEKIGSLTDRFFAIYDIQHDAAQEAGEAIRGIALKTVEQVFEKNPNASREDLLQEVGKKVQEVLDTHFVSAHVPKPKKVLPEDTD